MNALNFIQISHGNLILFRKFLGGKILGLQSVLSQTLLKCCKYQSTIESPPRNSPLYGNGGGVQTSPWLKSIIHSHLKGCGGPGSLLRWFKVCKCLSTWKVRAWLYYNVSNIWDEECIWEHPLCHYHLLHDWTPLRKWASQTGLQEQIGKGYSVSLVWSLPTADKLWIFHREW